ncbi:MAG: MOSC domain-containing protein [Pirellulales bacterium]
MNKNQGTVEGVCVSEGGIPRSIVPQIQIEAAGIIEDGHRYEEHSTAKRAVSLFDMELYSTASGESESCLPGSAGENIALRGVLLHKYAVGTTVQVGEVQLKIERIWIPCYTKSESTNKVVANKANVAGCFASVITPGIVKAGDTVTILIAVEGDS